MMEGGFSSQPSTDSKRIRKRKPRGTDEYDSPKRRKRTIISKEQRLKLEALFNEEQWPRKSSKESIAQEIGTSTHFISVWFQNRRSKLKKTLQGSKKLPDARERHFIPIAPKSTRESYRYNQRDNEGSDVPETTSRACPKCVGANGGVTERLTPSSVAFIPNARVTKGSPPRTTPELSSPQHLDSHDIGKEKIGDLSDRDHSQWMSNNASNVQPERPLDLTINNTNPSIPEPPRDPPHHRYPEQMVNRDGSHGSYETSGFGIYTGTKPAIAQVKKSYVELATSRNNITTFGQSVILPSPPRDRINFDVATIEPTIDHTRPMEYPVILDEYPIDLTAGSKNRAGSDPQTVSQMNKRNAPAWLSRSREEADDQLNLLQYLLYVMIIGGGYINRLKRDERACTAVDAHLYGIKLADGNTLYSDLDHGIVLGGDMWASHFQS